MLICSNCHAPLEDEAKFCDMCGTPVAAPPVSEAPAKAAPVYEAPAAAPSAAEPAAAQPLHCPNCGQPATLDSPFCGNCGKPLDESAFCPNCGKQVSASSALCPHCSSKLFDAVFCPNCGTLSNPNAAFCKSCGGSLKAENADPSVPPGKKAKKQKKAKEAGNTGEAGNAWKSKKGLVFGGIGVVAVVLIGVLAFSFLGKGGSSKLPNCALYVKDREIFYSRLSKKAPLQVTSRLADDDGYDNSDFAYASSDLGNICRFSKDGTLLFFPDKLNGQDSGYSLYYRKVGKPKEEAVKIDSDVESYSVSDDASSITYLKNGMLYQYARKKEDKQKIASDVRSYRVSNDGKTVLYLNEENMLYSVSKGDDRNKIDSDVAELCYVSDDLSLLFYLKEGTLYRKKEGKEKEKVASDVVRVIRAYESGEAYYLKSEDGELSLNDFVSDDKKKEDESMKEPEAPAWNDPNYNTKYKAYEEAMQEFYEKQNRDYLRESLEEYTLPFTNYTLCYDDGKKEKDVVISESFRDSSFSAASEAPVIAYEAYDPESDVSVKLSEITDLYEVEQKVLEARGGSAARYVATGSISAPLDLEDAVNLRLSADGKTLCYLAEVPKDKDYGELYRLSIAASAKLGKPEKYDSDVYTGYMRFVENGKFLYYKDYKNSKGELYLDGEKVDYDVHSANYDKDTGKLIYYTDWNSEKGYGTLKSYTKKGSVKISDDVHDCCVTPGGDVLYLYDYSEQYYRGELYLWDSKKATKIDDDVICIIPVR